MIRLAQLTEGTPYAGYAYSYPHKTAYRRLAPPRRLREVWAAEPKDAVYLYLHVPFCEMRCGFCNLFTTANPSDELADRYIAAVARQAWQVREMIGQVHVARMAIGGGTPTYLSVRQLEAALAIAADDFGVAGGVVPISVETSPRTADLEKLRLLRSFGVDRISIGVQSLVEAEVRTSGRAQKNEWVHGAVERIRGVGFPTLNLDLIYGLPGQTKESWLASLRAAMIWRPEEFYLYPLYVRPLTGLERWGRQPEDALRLSCYRDGRDFLLEHGYEQVSMRMFRRLAVADGLVADGSRIGTEYCCQEDGMIGLGCGARSYTRALHYSSEYAVGAVGVREIIANYIAKSDAAFAIVDYGCALDDAEQRRRWVIKSLLRAEGLDLTGYRDRFGTSALEDIPEIELLVDAELVNSRNSRLVPTADGLERSDAIGPWLYSELVQQGISAYEVR